MARHRTAEALSELEVTRAISRTPQDQFVIWTGDAAGSQGGSLRSRALGLVDEAWRPMALRALLLRAVEIEPGAGLHPDVVRSAVRMHQSARPSAYFLARRTLGGDYLAVTDIPYPAGPAPGGLRRPLPAGALLLGRYGQRFTDEDAAPMQRRAG
ncbi:hypothetical protein LJR225_000026 [Phenylobacterium sp. LjRoot225]|uniref:hypothetical protein n=1 Tax=Phenylobacterium sp. LjRoot225 TaxID=3342285 RepID=UPI003ED16A60